MKKVKIILSVVVLLIVTTLLIESCTEDLVQDNAENKEEIIDLSQVGKKLENPYKVATMKQAFKNLQQRQREQRRRNARSVEDEENLDETDFEVTTSHIYVKFKPTNSEEEAKLKQDSTLILSNLPLDYEFSEDELKKIENSASRKKNARSTTEGEDEEFFPEYYIAIPVEKKVVDGVPADKLEELYIPEEDPYFEEVEGSDSPSSRTKLSKKQLLLDQLLEEAFRIANNKPLETNSNERKNAWWIFGKKWYPSGKITRWDDVLQREVPVVGAQVLMRQWFTVRQGITDGNGNFSTGSVRGEARYVIQWERYQYSIRNGSLFQAETRGPKVKRQTWDHVIRGGDDLYHATIHQAAHDYYYGNRFGLISPPSNSFLKRQMKIAAREVNGASSHVPQRNWIGLAQIVIKEWGAKSDKVYGTTIHELAHASHWVKDRNAYNRLVEKGYIEPAIVGMKQHNRRAKRLLETWPTAVEIMFTLHKYRNEYGANWYNYLNEQNHQFRAINSDLNHSNNFYTSCGYDMIDDFNQRLRGSSLPIDQVKGYSLKQLEDALVNAYEWNDWKNNIKSKYTNSTSLYLDELFANWQD